MTAVTLLGLVAAALTTGAFFPQAVKVWRSDSSADLSLGTFVMMSVGVALWLVYGLLIGDVPLIAANAVSLAIIGSILAHIVRAHRRARAGASRIGDVRGVGVAAETPRRGVSTDAPSAAGDARPDST